MLISKKQPYGEKSSFKYFFGYNDDDIIRPLCEGFLKRLGMLST